MGAFEIVGQAHIHVDAGDGVLFALVAIGKNNGILQILDADTVDIKVSVVPEILYIFQYYLLLPIR